MISIFIVATLVLAFFELLLPGGILGTLAAVSLLVAIWFGFDSYGFFGGVMVFFGTLVALVIFSFVEFKLMVKTPYGKKFLLNTVIEGHSNQVQAKDMIVGKTGLALTRLNPSGKVLIDGKNYEAHSQDGYIENGERIVVVTQDTFKLIIKKT